MQIFLSSSLTALGLVFPQVWVLAPLGLGLFLAALRSSTSQLAYTLIAGLFFGLMTGAAGTIWFLDTLPLSFLGISDQKVQIVAVVMTWMYVALSLAAPVPLGVAVLMRYKRSHLFPMFAAATWVIVEICRMWCFALTTYGPNSLFGPHFSAAAIGYALTENFTLLQLANPCGLDALNGIAAFLAGLIACIPDIVSSTRGRKAIAFQIFGIIFVCTIWKVSQHASTVAEQSTTLRFAVVSTNIDSVRDEVIHPAVLEDLSSAMATKPHADVILLPEELGLTSIFWAKGDYQTFVERYTGGREVLIVNSRNELFVADEKNEAFETKKLLYESTSKGELGRYIKQMLMPLGEYAPAFTKTFFSIINDPSLHAYIDEVAAPYSSSVRTLSPGVFRGIRLGSLLCSDLFSPYLYRSLARDHSAQVLMNLSNQFWFHGSRTLHWKTRQIARMHAVQNRLPFLLANNSAPSLIIDASGRVISESRWGSRGVLYADIPFHETLGF